MSDSPPSGQVNCGHVRLHEHTGLPPCTVYVERLDCLFCEIERLREALKKIVEWGPDPNDAGMLSEDVYWVAKGVLEGGRA